MEIPSEVLSPPKGAQAEGDGGTGEGERRSARSTLILLQFLDPNHPDLLTQALGVFPRTWGGGEREKRKDRNLERASFALKKTLVSPSEYPCSRLRLLSHPSE